MELRKLYFKYFYTNNWEGHVAYIPTKKIPDDDTNIGYLYRFKEGKWYLPGKRYIDYDDDQWVQEPKMSITKTHKKIMLKDLFEKGIE